MSLKVWSQLETDVLTRFLKPLSKVRQFPRKIILWFGVVECHHFYLGRANPRRNALLDALAPVIQDLDFYPAYSPMQNMM